MSLFSDLILYQASSQRSRLWHKRQVGAQMGQQGPARQAELSRLKHNLQKKHQKPDFPIDRPRYFYLATLLARFLQVETEAVS